MIIIDDKSLSLTKVIENINEQLYSYAIPFFTKADYRISNPDRELIEQEIEIINKALSYKSSYYLNLTTNNYYK